MTRSPIPVAGFPGTTFLGTTVRAVLGVVQALRHRREIMHLAELDDRMLKDIGLMRGDVEGALAEALFRNPSRVLVRCAERHGRGEKGSAPVRSARPVVPVVRTRAVRA